MFSGRAAALRGRGPGQLRPRRQPGSDRVQLRGRLDRGPQGCPGQRREDPHLEHARGPAHRLALLALRQEPRRPHVLALPHHRHRGHCLPPAAEPAAAQPGQQPAAGGAGRLVRGPRLPDLPRPQLQQHRARRRRRLPQHPRARRPPRLGQSAYLPRRREHVAAQGPQAHLPQREPELRLPERRQALPQRSANRLRGRSALGHHDRGPRPGELAGGAPDGAHRAGVQGAAPHAADVLHQAPLDAERAGPHSANHPRAHDTAGPHATQAALRAGDDPAERARVGLQPAGAVLRAEGEPAADRRVPQHPGTAGAERHPGGHEQDRCRRGHRHPAERPGDGPRHHDDDRVPQRSGHPLQGLVPRRARPARALRVQMDCGNLVSGTQL